MIQEELLKEQTIDSLFKALENQKNNLVNVAIILDEINNRIANGQFSFSRAEKKYLYLYMFLSNKLEKNEILNKLITTSSFIKLLDETDIDGSMIPSLTSNCQKPRTTLITKSKKLKNSFLKGDNLLNTQDILADLTKEEISLFRQDVSVDNYLITNGLSFDTIKEETKKQLLNDLKQLSIYDITTINEFTANFKDLSFLVNNKEFLDLYLDKLSDEYYLNNRIFNYLDRNILSYILENNPSDSLLLHLIKDTNPELQKVLYNNPHLQELLKNCDNENILVKLPTTIIKDILVNAEDLFSDRNTKLLERLSKKDITYILENNKTYYDKLISFLNEEKTFNLDIFIKYLPSKYYFDLINNYFRNFTDQVIINLLKIDYKSFKKVLLANKELCTRILNHSSSAIIDEIFKIGHFEIEEKIKLITNSTKYQNASNIISIIEKIPLSYRKSLYLNSSLRQKLITSNNYNLDEYMISYYLNHPEEIKDATPSKIIAILNNADYNVTENVLKDKEVLTKILADESYYSNFIALLHKNPKLFTILSKESNFDLIDKKFVATILPQLNNLERKLLCSNDLIKHIYNDEEIFKVYKSLSTKNRHLLNTLNFNFLNEDTKNIKLSFLETITKYPDIQENLLTINKTFKVLPEFINSICYNETSLSLSQTLSKCIKIITDSTIGINRKKIGNIPRIMSILNNDIFSKTNTYVLIEYLLYLIPRYYNKDNQPIKRPIYLETPMTYNDILYYTAKTEEYLTNQINKKDLSHTKEYFIAKHFKLSLEEAQIMLNIYSLNRIDNNIYTLEYEYLDNLNKIYHTDEISLINLDPEYKIYSKHDSFTIEYNIKKMYGKIFNYEIRSKTYSNNPFTKTLYGKEIKIFDCPNDFLFLISNVDIKEEYLKTNSYIEAWHNTLDKLSDGIDTSLISNDHLIFKHDFLFGFNGLLDEGLLRMSNHNLSLTNKDTSKEKYMTPRELIDNSRDQKNTLVISRYAIRPNYNNANLPYLEPDYILVDKNKLNDNTYLENISRASEEFKTKRNKDGLPIIALDFSKIVDSETRKIKQLITKYQKNHDMTILPSLFTKLINNYSAYSLYNEKIADKFNIDQLIEIVKSRIQVSNSISELNFIKETIINEYNKYKNNSKQIICHIDIKELKNIIKERQEIINNT